MSVIQPPIPLGDDSSCCPPHRGGRTVCCLLRSLALLCLFRFDLSHKIHLLFPHRPALLSAVSFFVWLVVWLVGWLVVPLVTFLVTDDFSEHQHIVFCLTVSVFCLKVYDFFPLDNFFLDVNTPIPSADSHKHT